MFGHGRSGLTWSGVSGETPPQSSTPARSSRPSSVESDRFGGACTRAFGPSSSRRDRDRGDVLLQLQVVVGLHRRPGLGPEVLDDDLLHVPVPLRRGPDLADRVDPLGVVLADAQQHAGGERDGGAPGVLQHPQPDGGLLVRGAEVRAAGLRPQPGRRRLQHHAHRGGDRLEPLDLLPGQHARVEVGEQPGLLQHPDRHRPQVAQRRVEAVRVQPLGGDRPAVLGAVAEGEQRLLAAHRRAGAGDVEHLVRRQERRLALRAQLPRRRHERAVVAAVAAQVGERDEHLAAVGHDARPAGRGEPGVAHPAGRGQQPVQRLAVAQAAGVQQRLGLGGVEGHPALGADERAAQRGLGRGGQRTHPANASPGISDPRSPRTVPVASRQRAAGGDASFLRCRGAGRTARSGPRSRRSRRRPRPGRPAVSGASLRNGKPPSPGPIWTQRGRVLEGVHGPAPQAVGGQQDPRDRAHPRDALVAQRARRSRRRRRRPTSPRTARPR